MQSNIGSLKCQTSPGGASNHEQIQYILWNLPHHPFETRQTGRQTTGTCAFLQVLPFVEAFFVLCEARTSHLPQPEPGMLRAASSDLARSGSGVTASASGSVPAPGLLTPAASGQLPQQQRAVLDAHLPFLRSATSLGPNASSCALSIEIFCLGWIHNCFAVALFKNARLVLRHQREIHTHVFRLVAVLDLAKLWSPIDR